MGADEALEAWIVWRLGRATAGERLRRVGVPLFPNWRARRHENPSRRWTHDSLRATWEAACEIAGVRGVPLYAGTKHSTATELFRRGVDRTRIQAALGHADARSTDAYVVLADADTLDVFRRRKP